MGKTALITGITGQDGSYLTDLLLKQDYEVHGIVRRSSMFNRSRIEHLRTDPAIYEQRLFLHYADLDDATTLRRLIRRVHPDEIYHLAGQSHVGLSFEIPESTCDDVAKGTLSLLEICRDLEHAVRIYHASSSEIFGRPSEREVPQNETTPRRPQSPYGCAKVFSTDLCQVYREAYGLFVCSGIAYNHESPRRGESFVTRKITSSAARIRAGLQDCLWLGNLSARRDWGFAAEYVDAMWRMMQREQADDFVLATGQVTSVRDFAKAAFAALDIQLTFSGKGEAECGREVETGRELVRVDPRFYRPADPLLLVGDPTKANVKLGWKAATQAPALAALMAQADWAAISSPDGHSKPPLASQGA
jgi:GDPmannose 4,6-dehydratase